MAYVLLHHTGCGTSRKGLALLEENGVQPQVRKYMNQSEQLSEAELRDVAAQMGAASPREFLRDKDALKFDLPPDADDDAVFAAMADNPRLIQRPIGEWVAAPRAFVGRSPSAPHAADERSSRTHRRMGARTTRCRWRLPSRTHRRMGRRTTRFRWPLCSEPSRCSVLL